MKILSSFFLLALIGVTIAQDNNLQCYVCDECGELTNAMLSYCGPDQPTTTPTTTTTTAATPTTSIIPLTSEAASTDASATTTTVASGGSTVLEDTTTTVDVVGSTSTETPPPATTAAAPATEPTTAAPADPTTAATADPTTAAPADPTTAAPVEPTTDAATIGTTGEEVVQPLAQQVPQEVPAPATSNSGVVPSNSAAPNVPQQPSPAALLIRNYRAISRATRADASGISYACYKIDLSGNDSDSPKWKRGCVAVPVDKNGCQVVREENELPADGDDSCRHCTTDGCNSSAALQLSLGALLTALLIKFLM